MRLLLVATFAAALSSAQDIDNSKPTMRFGGPGGQQTAANMNTLWRTGGAAEITEGANGRAVATLNGASRRSVGSLWSVRSQDVSEMSAIFELESRGGSGSAKPTSSAAIFITRNTGWVQGNGAIAGTHESFAGVAVAIRGYGKDERGRAAKRDIEIFVNDEAGRLKLDALVSPGHGCPAPTLGTKRGADGVSRIRIKLLLYQATLFVLHFNEANQQWEDCDTVALDQYSRGSGLQSMVRPPPLPPMTPCATPPPHMTPPPRSPSHHAPPRPALQHIGFSASAGPSSNEQMALTYVRALSKWDQDPEMPDEADERHAASRHGAPHTNSNPEGETVEQRVSRMQLREYAVERRLKELKDRVVARMLRRLERIEAAHTRDAAQHALTRISTLAEELKVKSSQALEDRIKELEAGLKGSVMATITQRLVAIESQLTGTLCSLQWCACSLPPPPRARAQLAARRLTIHSSLPVLLARVRAHYCRCCRHRQGRKFPPRRVRRHARQHAGAHPGDGGALATGHRRACGRPAGKRHGTSREQHRAACPRLRCVNATEAE